MHRSRIRGLAASAGVRLRANETEISAALWAHEARGRSEHAGCMVACRLHTVMSRINLLTTEARRAVYPHSAMTSVIPAVCV